MHSNSANKGLRRRLLTLFFGGLLIASIAYFILSRDQGEALPRQMDFAVFNTLCRLSVWSLPAAQSEALFSELNQQFRLLHDCINVYDPKSELSVLNRHAATAPVICSPMLWDLLMSAREAWRISDGAFDVSIGPLMRLWGFHEQQNAVPSQQALQAACRKVGMDKMVFDESQRSVAFGVPGMRIDLGGIAKGYALDLAADILQRHAARIYLLDLGGNIACSAIPPPGRSSFNIGIRDPLANDRLLGSMPLLGRFAASSGNYERYRIIDGQRVGHIMDPRSGLPCSGIDGVSVITTSGVFSDVFSTAVFVGQEALAEKLCASFPGTGFILIKQDGQGQAQVEHLGDITQLERQNSPGVVN
jgi:thiamine biosynthesis lipoprotein